MRAAAHSLGAALVISLPNGSLNRSQINSSVRYRPALSHVCPILILKSTTFFSTRILLMLRVLTLCAALLATILPITDLRAQASDRTYTNPAHQWVIAYPSGWAVDSQNIAFVQIRPPNSLATGVIGIHTGAVGFKTIDELVDAVIRSQQASEQGVRILSRRSVQLADSVPGIDLETELGVGTVGRSRRLFVLWEGTAYVIDAETYRDSWPVLAPYYARVIQSFRIPSAMRTNAPIRR